MSDDSPASVPPDEPAAPEARAADDDAGTADAMRELRSLLVGPVTERIDSLEDRYAKRAADVEAVGNVLAEAVAAREAKDDKLARALRPTLEGALNDSVRKNRQIFVDAVYPALGPAIRKAIAATMRSMVQSLNRAIEQRYSLQGLKWRIEAYRTGRSFAEVVFLHTLVFRVEQAFLIHAETGLLLQHVVAEDVQAPNADMVSGMLTAIQDFVRDSFTVDGQASLDDIRVGELTVWIERGPAAVVAAVIRGEAPESLREELEIALESVHAQMADELSDFQGDPAPFERVRPHLEQCVVSRQRETAAAPNRTLWLVILLLVAVGGVLGARAWRTRTDWRTMLDALRDEPGIVVTSVGERDGRRLVRGLRDPLAADPREIVAASPIAPEEVEFALRPYTDLAPEFVLTRAQTVLKPEPGVGLDLIGTKLVARGEASHGWLRRAQVLAPAVAGVDVIDLHDVRDRDLDALNEAMREVTSRQLRFVSGGSDLVAGQERTLRTIAAGLERVFERARTTGGSFVVRIAGHTDATGDPEENLVLSRERAESIARALRARGLAIPIETVGFGSERPRKPETEDSTDAEREANRRVEFEVRSLDAAPPTPD